MSLMSQMSNVSLGGGPASSDCEARALLRFSSERAELVVIKIEEHGVLRIL